MNEATFAQIQIIELQRLIEQAGDDPILVPQLQQRVAELNNDLARIRREPGSLLPKDELLLPRTAIFMRGEGVQGSTGIRPALAGEALIQYERMFVEQALHDEREAAKFAGRQRRPRGASKPGLLFTGTPRGSFGLEFVPQAKDETTASVHARSLVNVAEALTAVASDTESLDQSIAGIPPRVLQPMKQFLKTLAYHGAELRLAFSDKPSRSLSVEQVKVASERLEREVEQVSFSKAGIFRGVTFESGVFDLLSSNGELITGVVADELAEEDLERFAEFTNKQCVVDLQSTIVNTLTGPGTPKYVLLDVRPATEPTALGVSPTPPLPPSVN